MAEVLTIGEPMGLFVADEAVALKDANHFTKYVCGAEVNFSIGLSRLGHKMAYVSRVGKDPIGEHIIDFLNASGIDTTYVVTDPDNLTGMQFKEKVTDGHDPFVANYRRHTAFSHFDPKDLDKIKWDGIKHVHVTGIPAALSDSCCAAAERLMKDARAHGATVSFDPNLRPMLWPNKEKMVATLNKLADNADLVLPGLGEGETLIGTRNPKEIADFYIGKGAKSVVIKLGGADGAYGKTKDGDEFNVPSFKVEKVVDTVGAGDGFAVGTVSALLEGKSLKDAARRGAAIGALAIMVAGDNEGLPTRDKLEKFMAQ
ncbi:MAG: sugar kinase [Selenomonadaceae bacterium]|nr:sugar kinase [Selenomonadaceae bacterium]